MNNYINIAIIAFLSLIGAIWVARCISVGRKNALARESRCTEMISATVKNIKEHHFFFAKYYNLDLHYQYNKTDYEVHKAWFGSWDNSSAILLHINPQNPNECYITTLAEKCKRK